MPEIGPNYKRFPNWDLMLGHNLPHGPMRISPTYFQDDEMVEGRRIRTYGVAWLFFNLMLEFYDKKHDGKAGFLS